jgi:hypothetical protein
MKDTCPQCGSKKIIPEVLIIDQSPTSSGGMPRDNPLNVRIDTNPEAWIFKGSHYSQLVARICGECGFAELRAKDPRPLYPLYLQYLGSRGGA